MKAFIAIVLVILVSVEEGDFAPSDKCEGKDCDKKVKECQPGFWGEPCKKCDCDGRADTCDYTTGKCFCNTKGVTGDKCDKCDEKKLYIGDAINGHCYYDIVTSIFILKLNSPANKHVKKLNLKFSPEDPKDNIIFSINCAENCKSFELSMEVKEDGNDKKVVIAKQVIKGNEKFEKILSQKEYKFGVEKEKPVTEFFIHITGVETPTVLNFNVIPESKKDDTFMIFYES